TLRHEIRTPMNAIVGLTHLLQRDGVTPEQSERLRKIDTAAHHLLSIINDVLDLSKIEADRMVLEEFNFALAALLENVCSLIAEEARAKGLAGEVEVDPAPLWLSGTQPGCGKHCSTTPATPSSSLNRVPSCCGPASRRKTPSRWWCASKCRMPASASPPKCCRISSRRLNRATRRRRADTGGRG